MFKTIKEIKLPRSSATVNFRGNFFHKAFFTLKNVWKTYEYEKTSKINARNVLNPPKKTAGPIKVKVLCIRTAEDKNICFIDSS